MGIARYGLRAMERYFTLAVFQHDVGKMHLLEFKRACEEGKNRLLIPIWCCLFLTDGATLDFIENKTVSVANTCNIA